MSLAATTRDLLSRYNLRLRKSLGQHLLLNSAKAAQIAAATLKMAAEQEVGTILEIGPGLGALTTHLAASGLSIVGCEIDTRFQAPLAELIASSANVTIYWQDILKTDVASLLGQKRYIATGNLPYQIVSPLLEKLLPDPLCGGLVITVQKEVAERIMASPGTKDYGPLTLFCQYYLQHVEPVVPLTPRDFLPPPQVSSLAIKLQKRARPPFSGPSADYFFRIVRAAFQHRRKFLLSALAMSGLLALSREQMSAVLEETGIAEDRRAETLSLAEFARLALALQRREDTCAAS